MPITLTCTCGKTLQAGEQHRGQSATCPACGNAVTTTAEQRRYSDAEKPIAERCERRPVNTWAVVAILGGAMLLVSLTGYSFLMAKWAFGAEQREAALDGTMRLTLACQAYQVEHKRFPDNLQRLLRLDRFHGRFI